MIGIADTYQCFYVSGNHEFWSGRASEHKGILRSYGVTVLEGDRANVTIRGQEIVVVGIDDPDGGQMRFENQMNSLSALLPPESYTILLSHRPEIFECYIELDVDLVLCGHAHGGQWRIPLILRNGLLAPNQGLFPKYTDGIHIANDTTMIVSRGLSQFAPQIPRIFNPPELVVVNLTPA